MDKANHFHADNFPGPHEDAIWGIQYCLDVLVDGDRSQWDDYSATIRSTGDIEDVLQMIRDAWIGKVLYSPGCDEPGCSCGGVPQRARVLGVKFNDVRIIAHLTDLDVVVAHATSTKRTRGGPSNAD